VSYIKKISSPAHRDLCLGSEVKPFTNKFNIGENDCPPFYGVYKLSQISCGGSIDAAIMLNHKNADICINWAGTLNLNIRWTSSCKEIRSFRVLLLK